MTTHDMRTAPAALMAAALAVGAPAIATAQSDYPNRPVRIIASVGAGTVADAVPRIIADKLSMRWRQPVVVENRPGGSNNIGAEAAARAEADGYTLLAAPPTPLVINQHLFPKLAFDPAAFVPVAVLAEQPNVLVAHPKVPASDLRQLVSYARSNAGNLTYGSSGAGSLLAGRLGISAKTVRNQVSIIFSKLEVNSRAQAIVRARDAGFGRKTGG